MPFRTKQPDPIEQPMPSNIYKNLNKTTLLNIFPKPNLKLNT